MSSSPSGRPAASTVEAWPSRRRSSWSDSRTAASTCSTAALEQHRDALAEPGVTGPAKSADEMFRAAVEIRREHRAWGLRRKDVEGTWSNDLPPGHQAPGHRRRRPRPARRRTPGRDRAAGRPVARARRCTWSCSVGVPDAPGRRCSPTSSTSAACSTAGRPRSRSPDRLHVVVVDPADPRRSPGGRSGRWSGSTPTGWRCPTRPAVVPRDRPATLRLIAESAGVHVDRRRPGRAGRGVGQARRRARVRRARRPARPGPASGRPASTDPARAAYDQRVDVLTEALAEAVAEVGDCASSSPVAASARERWRLAAPSGAASAEEA